MRSGPLRIGYLGGTFDPVHLGHVALVRAARSGGRLDEVRLLPAGRPPHKDGLRAITPGIHRAAMLDAAFADDDGVRIDARELGRARVSYTIDTMTDIRAEEPDATLCFIIGMDTLGQLPTWRRIEDLARIVTFLVAARPGEDAAVSRHAASAISGLNWERLEVEETDVSSSGIRARVASGETLEGLVPDAVAAYIADEGLYA